MYSNNHAIDENCEVLYKKPVELLLSSISRKGERIASEIRPLSAFYPLPHTKSALQIAGGGMLFPTAFAPHFYCISLKNKYMDEFKGHCQKL